jgi:hypothetical protein
MWTDQDAAYCFPTMTSLYMLAAKGLCGAGGGTSLQEDMFGQAES